jgi:hypothetical protein
VDIRGRIFDTVAGMTTLVEEVLDSHGGRDRWSSVVGLDVELRLGGPFWASLGWPDVWNGQVATLDARRERIAFTPYPSAGHTVTYDAADGERIRITDGDGAVVDERQGPRASFPPYAKGTTWDAIQTAYFTSVAVWNYLVEPFLFTWPGVEAREIEPWQEGGQTWRRLAVHFPAELPNHNPDQVFYYDSDFRQRRMDYQPQVTGAPAAHYTHDPVVFDGLLFYTRRVVHLHDAKGATNFDVAPITLDIASVRVRTE